MNEFIIVLGEENPILPGRIWTEYNVEVLEEKMICIAKKNPTTRVEIFYSSFKNAEFGIGNGNLWLQCELEEGKLNFCSPRKNWKSEEAKKLIELIDAICPIKDMKAYKKYTGGFWFLSMFK